MWSKYWCGLLFASLLVTAQPTRAEPARRKEPARAEPKPRRPLPARDPAEREADPPTPSWGENRVMEGHRFPFPQFVPSSFIVSSFAVHVGVESRRVPNYPTDVTLGAVVPGRIYLKTISATQGLDLAVRVHELVALTVAAYGQARLGTNTPSLLGSGADYLVGVDAGGIIRLFRSDRFQLSLRITGGYHKGQHAGITQLYQNLRTLAQSSAERALQGQDGVVDVAAGIDTALSEAVQGLSTTSRGFRVATMLTAAWAMASWIGLQAMVGFNYDRNVSRYKLLQADTWRNMDVRQTTDLRRLMAGMALDVGAASSGIPLDVVAEYALYPLSSHKSGEVARVVDQTTTEHQLALGLYYSGRPDLQLGFNLYMLLAQLREFGAAARASGKARDMGGVFTFRYIW